MQIKKKVDRLQEYPSTSLSIANRFEVLYNPKNETAQIESVTKLPPKSNSNAKDRMVKEAVSLKENKIRRRKKQRQCTIFLLQ